MLVVFTHAKLTARTTGGNYIAHKYVSMHRFSYFHIVYTCVKYFYVVLSIDHMSRANWVAGFKPMLHQYASITMQYYLVLV